MIYSAFIVFILARALFGILNVTGLRNRLQSYAANSNSKVLYKLTNCDFCIHFWLSVFLSIPFIFTEIRFLILPFLSQGIFTIITYDLRSR